MPRVYANNVEAAKRISRTLASQGYKLVKFFRNLGGRHAYAIRTYGRKAKGRVGRVIRT